MAGTSSTVSRWAGLARRAQEQTGVPATVLLGLIEHESGGQPGLTSSAGAKGITQFMPGTATTYSVDTSPGHEWSQILGAAHYLTDLGYKDDPRKALASYAGGPANPQYGYADAVLSLAKKYTGAGGTTSSTSTAAPATSSGTAPASSSGGGLFGQTERSGAVRALTYTSLSVGGLVLVGFGVSRALGLRLSSPLTLQGQLLGKA